MGERALLLLAAILALGCAGEGATVVRPDTFADRACPEDSTLAWETFGDPFMRSWCTGCHSSGLPEDRRAGAPVGVDFDAYEGVEGRLEQVWALAADQHEVMPPGGGPGPDERALLGEWLACERDGHSE